nr:MAG TPA: hypothetical protein [Caudovirales sp. ctNII2]
MPSAPARPFSAYNRVKNMNLQKKNAMGSDPFYY